MADLSEGTGVISFLSRRTRPCLRIQCNQLFQDLPPPSHVPACARNWLELSHFLFIYAFIPNVSYTPSKQTCKGNLLMREETRAQMTQRLAWMQSQQVLQDRPSLSHNCTSQDTLLSSSPSPTPSLFSFLNNSHLFQAMTEGMPWKCTSCISTI